MPKIKLMDLLQRFCSDEESTCAAALSELQGLPIGYIEEHPISQTKGRPFVKKLAALADKHPSPEVREWSAQLIGEIGIPDPVCVPALNGILSTRKGSAVVSAIWALGTIGPTAKDAVPGLLLNSRNGNPEIRWRVFWALEKIGFINEHVQVEILHALSDSSSLVRGYALSACAKAELLSKALTGRINEMLSDPDPFPRAEAAKVKRKLGDA